MKYISTRDEKKNKIKKDFKYVTLKGLADDGGLYVPYKFPMFKQDKINNFKKMNYSQFSAEIISEFTGQDLNKDEIFKLSSKIYKKFSGKDVVSIKNFDKDKFLLELFHGPTFAFKDFALQLLGEIFDKFLIEEKKEMLILTATSGDTGSAAIEAFKNRKNIKIIILHPFEKVSEFQRRQMTTINSKNVFNIAINGNFDDCQKLVKSLFLDKKFNNDYNLGSVNSINWARILPQVVYYAYSAIKINNSNPNQLVNFVVPTGNFGDAYAGYVAKKVGFPIDKIIVATNSNDILSRFFSTGIYKRQRVKSTLSPSMDIQIASNFERLLNEIAYEDSIKVPEYMKQFSEKGFLSVDNKLLKKLLESFKSFSIAEYIVSVSLLAIFIIVYKLNHESTERLFFKRFVIE